MAKYYLFLGLSSERHLEDEVYSEDIVIYAGPRQKNGLNTIRTGNNPNVKQLIDSIKRKTGRIDGVVVLGDIYSLQLFNPDFSDYEDKNKITAIVGDTHHGVNPITMLIKWLKHAGIKKIILKQTSHQEKIFEACGFNVDVFTHYAHRPSFKEPTEGYLNRIIFFGSLSERHIRRKRLIEGLIKRGIPIDICSGSRESSFQAYNVYAASINMPLNRDLNFRISEIMASSGVCITEAFAYEGQGLCARNNVNIINYRNIDECEEICKKILVSRDIRMKIAENAFNRIKRAKENKELMATIKSSIEKDTAMIDISDNYRNIEKYEERQNIAVRTGVFFNHEKEVQETLGIK